MGVLPRGTVTFLFTDVDGSTRLLHSRAARGLVEGELAADLRLRDLAAHRLKDLEEPVRLYQLCGEGLESDFPPPDAHATPRTNLPVQATPFLGRERELSELVE